MNESTPKSRRLYAALWVATLLVYGSIFALSQNKLIYTDEIVFAQDFVHVAQGQWQQIIIPHPPLYIFLGGLAVSLFGDGFLALRLIGGISFLLALALIPIVCRKLFPANWLRVAIIAHLIWAFHPMALQGSLLLDIDNTIFAPALLLFVITTSTPRKNAFIIAISVTLLLMSKLLPTSLFIIAGVITIGILQGKQRSVLVMGLAVGFAILAGILFVFAQMTGFPLGVLVATLERTGNIAQGSQKLISRLVMGGGITAVWIGIPFLGVYGLAIIRRVLDWRKSKQFPSSDVLILTAIVGIILVTIGNELPMGFPRYHYPLFLLMVLTASAYLAELKITRDAVIVMVILGVIGAAYFLVVQPDSLLPQYQLTFETNNMMERLKFALNSQFIALVIPFALMLMATALAKKRSPLILACLAFSASSWVVTDITQARANYATIYEYGREGGAATSEWVKANTAPAALIVAPREVEWLSKRKTMFVVTQVGPTATAEGWLQYFTTEKPSAYVLTTKELLRYTQVTNNPQVLSYLQTCYRQHPSMGSYHIWLRSCP